MDWCTFYLDSKVQEFPNSEIKAEGLLPGPVLHISCSQNVKLLEAATIKIPLTVREDGRSLATSDHWLPQPLKALHSVFRSSEGITLQ